LAVILFFCVIFQAKTLNDLKHRSADERHLVDGESRDVTVPHGGTPKTSILEVCSLLYHFA